MTKRTSLFIAAIAVMLMAASSVYAYKEAWGGWFSSGTLTYSGYDYTYSGEGGTALDSTAGTIDTFYRPGAQHTPFPFVCSEINDTIYLTITDIAGSKPTGTTGTKEGDGTWTGSGLVASTSQSFTIWGDWDATFDYGDTPPTYDGTWDRTGSTPITVTGDGTSEGERTNYIP